MKPQSLPLGSKVRYTAVFYPPHPKTGRQGTIKGLLSNDGYEVDFGDGELWYCQEKNLKLVRPAKDKI